MITKALAQNLAAISMADLILRSYKLAADERPEDHEFGAWTCMQRTVLGLNQIEFAFDVGMAQTTLSRIENGGRFSIESRELVISYVDQRNARANL